MNYQCEQLYHKTHLKMLGLTNENLIGKLAKVNGSRPTEFQKHTLRGDFVKQIVFGRNHHL